MRDNTYRFDSPADKASYVNAMFARIAGRYDLLNRVMTLGRDQAWRRRAIELAAIPPGGRLLDVAIGTGDLALTCLELDPSARVAGVDFTLEMMRLGQSKEAQYLARAHTRTPVGWTGGDALRLPYADDAFDAVVSGFMMRNVTDIAGAFAEQRRVVRRGGHVVCLEITRPTVPLWRDFYRSVFYRGMPLLTGLVSGQPDAYRYLPASLEAFVDAEQLKKIMVSVGLRGVGYQTLMWGTVAIHVGVR
jgi:demethylmenaquinone methyltransferase/2-methoxy-6-polyprenyl-1,4-benzoquinol methylase